MREGVHDSDNSSKRLAHFLDNRNFQGTRGKSRRAAIPQRSRREDPGNGDSLRIVEGRIVINEEPRLRTEECKEDRVTSTTYRKHTTKRTRWTREETFMFYKALKVCGTDFTLMEKVFFDRERKQLKNKFNKEEKENGELVGEALGSKRKFTREDLDLLKKEYAEAKLSG